MKYLFLFFALIIMTIGTGCMSVSAPIKKAIDNVPVSSSSNDYIDADSSAGRYIQAQTELKTLGENFGANRFIPSKYLTGIVDLKLPEKDCVGVENGYTFGGDLLNSLAGDEKAQQKVKLSVFSSSYLSSLRARLDKYIATHYSSNLFPFYVCHLAEGIDLIAGSLWPKDKSPYSIKTSTSYRDPDQVFYDVKVSDEFMHEKTLLLLRSDTEYEFKNIQTIIANATGGETRPCDAALTKSGIHWSCFTGLGVDAKNNATFEMYDDWLLSLDGKIIKEWRKP